MATFRDKVIKAVSQIPKGRTLSYKQVAIKAGRPKAHRAVGNILNNNYNKGSRIPCHRVIRSDGSIGGYANGMNKKRELLKKEERK